METQATPGQSTVIIVIDGETEREWLLSFLGGRECVAWRSSLKAVVLLALLSQAEGAERERETWHSLFDLRAELERRGFSVSVGMERGSPFNLLNLVQTLETNLLLIPKEKFLMVPAEEIDDFLHHLTCPVLIY